MGDLQKSLSDLTAGAVEAFKSATLDSQKQVGDPSSGLMKTTTAGISTATGLVWFDLQTPAKNLFPVLTPLRNLTPRVAGGGGTATNWRRVTAINALNQQPFVPQGRRGGVISTTADSPSANYAALGLEDSVTIEAELAAVSFEDIRATTAQRLLWATMIQEEISILGANTSTALAKPVIGGLTKTDTGGTIAALTYNVRVVALTLAGFYASSVANGLPGLVSITNPANYTYTFGGGTSLKSDAVAVTTTQATSTISGYCAVVPGAAGYAWFVDNGAGGDLKLQAITSVNSFTLTSLSTANQAMSTLFDADHSTNAYGFDGLIYQAFKSGSNAYLNPLATGTPGVGTKLTADGAGGIVQINDMFQSMWDNYRLGPTRLFVNSQQAIDISNKIVGTGGIFRFVSDNPGTGLQNLTGGGRVKVYINKVGMDGNVEVPIEIHPNLPAGMLLAYTERLPYPMPNVTNVAEVRYQRDYYQIDWPMRERQYETGVYSNEVYAHYFPPSIGVIYNIAAG
jgi:hypothetical protein